ncbi:MAG: mechanosensitive ion channel family protein [Clostridium sp.]|nr:mechanosensitive ion channel family protein [Prevotella sp.]MCM1428216.1 mechanosensitive ion channel family protein [Clostridium sp.]MCM1475946.1 mechanosensitive ion channel family protein [Muribaculaceae bacterium]
MIPLFATHVAHQATRAVIDSQTEENYYAIARVIMKIDHWILDFFGLGHNSTLFLWLYAILVFALSFVIGWVLQLFVVWITRAIGKKFDTDLYRRLREHHFFVRASRIIPPLIFLILIQFTFTSQQSLSAWLSRFCWVYITFVVSLSLCKIADSLWEHIDERENKRKLPLKGLVQLIKGILWIIAVIFCVGILCDKSPTSLLAGLGAFSAVLMLVFKDNILGVVAGVQLSENDSLHVGDWIKVSGTDANGTVLEVTLTSVKVQNWDKTITTLPPYSLISGSFTNYRNMQLSNTRRIQRSYMIDADSVLPTDDAMLDEYAKLPLLKEWIAAKRAQRAAGKVCDSNNPDGLADGSIESNLGVFRAYLTLYLNSHPQIARGDDNTCFVTTLGQTPTGIPLQIYCFTNTSSWLPYEAIQASVFEHIAVMLYRFNLYTFENPTGRDTLIDGYLSPGKCLDGIYGIPYPFFAGEGTPQNPGAIDRSSNASNRNSDGPSGPSTAPSQMPH